MEKSLEAQIPVLPEFQDTYLLQQVAFTFATDVTKDYGGIFLVTMVANHTGEAVIGLTQEHAHSQSPRTGNWSW
jgi:hypothetical protein